MYEILVLCSKRVQFRGVSWGDQIPGSICLTAMMCEVRRATFRIITAVSSCPLINMPSNVLLSDIIKNYPLDESLYSGDKSVRQSARIVCDRSE